MNTATLPLAILFKDEIREARRLGYTVKARAGELAVVVRLVPTTQRTKAIAAGNNAQAIESTVPYNGVSEAPFAFRDAIAAVMQHARDAAA